MRLRTQVKQAIQCCALLAVRSGNCMTTRALSATFDLPKDYLAKTLQALAHAKIVTASYGPGGGYRLSREARGISILEIIEAIEGPIDSPRSKGSMLATAEPPAQALNQAVERLIEEVNAAWQSVLAGLTIEDLLGEVGPSQRASQGESWE
ncbi:Rrf2 family transcriptional regulator [Rhizobium sp. No.120]